MAQFTISSDQNLIKPEPGRYIAVVEKVKLKSTKSGTPMLSVAFGIRLKPTGHPATMWHTFFLSGMGSHKAAEFVRAIKPDFRNGDDLNTDFLIDKRVEIDVAYNLNPKTEWEKDRPLVVGCYPVIEAGESFKIGADMFEKNLGTFGEDVP